MLYRVRIPKESEGMEFEMNLPGGNSSLTGFWTRSLEAAKILLADREEICNLYANTSTYAKLFQIAEDQATIVADFSQYKNGHDDRYDTDEIFVSAIVGEVNTKANWLAFNNQ